LGLGLAKLVAKKGANVIIVARNVENLKAALEQISVCQSRPYYRGRFSSTINALFYRPLLRTLKPNAFTTFPPT
jgi:NAD(P)-dependent dehydrogenase (short-subunit alcohol dehydrogenase family)